MFGKTAALEPPAVDSNIKLISDAAARFLGATSPEVIRQVVGDCVYTLSGAKLVSVSRYDPATDYVEIGHLSGFEKIRAILEKRGWIDYAKSRVSISSMTKNELRDFTSGSLKYLEGGIHALSGRAVPKFVASAMQGVLGITGVYSMGFSWAGMLFGGVSLLMTGGQEPANIEEIEATITLGAVALQRTFAEKERANMEEKLLQAQKMEAVGRLAGGVAHDFNNLLTVITGYSDLALSNISDEVEVRQAIEEIALAASKASSLTQQLLAFSRRQVVRPEILDMGEVATGLHSMLTRLVGEHIDLQFPTVGNRLCVSADLSQLEQLIINLVTNARDAMPKGGAVTLSLDTVTVERDSELSEQLEDGRYIALRVIDTGDGMDADTLSHIFEPFFTTKETGKGTGLGLASAYGVVTQSGGTIVPVSSKGHGTTIAIYLPEVKCTQAADSEAHSVHSARGGAETILLVEDEAAVRKLIGALLERQGYNVIIAEDPRRALDLCKVRGDSIDLLITDLVMPEMNGRELSERVHQVCPKTKVLFVSGYTEDTVLQHGVHTGSMAFLQKPFDAGALVYRVRSILDGTESENAKARS